MGQSRNLARLDAVESAIPERVREVLAGEVIPEIRARRFVVPGLADSEPAAVIESASDGLTRLALRNGTGARIEMRAE